MPEPSAKIAGTIIRDKEGRYLLVQETRPDIYGRWGLPAGHVDEGETPQQAAIRETLEETGYKTVLISDEPFFEAATNNHHPYSTFSAEIIGGDLRVDPSEQLDVRWFSFNEIQSLHSAGKLRDNLIFNAIQKAENQ